jgi:hypothetical protein
MKSLEIQKRGQSMTSSEPPLLMTEEPALRGMALLILAVAARIYFQIYSGALDTAIHPDSEKR